MLRPLESKAPIERRNVYGCWCCVNYKQGRPLTAITRETADRAEPKMVIFGIYRRRATRQTLGTQRLLNAAPENGSRTNGAGAGAIAGLRLRPDERTRFPGNREDDDDVESVVDENSRLLKDSDKTPDYETSALLAEGAGPVLPAVDSEVWRNEHSRTHPSR